MNSSLTLPMILNLVFSKLHSGYGHASCLISKLSFGVLQGLHPLILRLLVPAVLRTRVLQDAPAPADSNS